MKKAQKSQKPKTKKELEKIAIEEKEQRAEEKKKKIICRRYLGILALLIMITIFLVFLTSRLGFIDEIFKSKVKKTDKLVESTETDLYEMNGQFFMDGKEGTIDVEEDELRYNLENRIEKINISLIQIDQRINKIEFEVNKMNEKLQEIKLTNYLAPLVVSLVNLKETISKGSNFKDNINNLEFLANGNMVILSGLVKIKQYSDDIKTKEFINEEFQRLAKEFSNKTREPSESDSLVKKIRYNLLKSISIRKVDVKRKPNKEELILINAENFLDSCEYESAISEINKLDEKYKTLFKEWIADTTEFVHVNSVVDDMLQYIKEIR